MTLSKNKGLPVPLRNRRPATESECLSDDNTIDNEDETNILKPLESELPWDRIKVLKLFRRAVTSLCMIIGFIGLLFMGSFWVGSLIAVIVVKMYREISTIKRIRNKENTPLYFTLRYYWFNIFLFSSCHHYLPMIGRAIEDFFGVTGVEEVFLWMVNHKNALFWSLVFCGVVGFVVSLSKYSAKYQFTQFAFMMVPCMFFAQVARGAYVTLFAGMYWIIVSFGSVICNDCCAYIFGVLFGKHRLLAISPNKTWEGYIGAFIATILFVNGCACIAPYISDTLCPQKELYINPIRGYQNHVDSCELSGYLLSTQTYEVDLMQFGMWTLNLSPITIHSMVIALFASFGAPFGGFFASGLKRSTGIKDFGQTLGLHGGWLDRFDCHTVMAIFMRVYLDGVILKGISQAGDLTAALGEAFRLSDSDSILLVKGLMEMHPKIGSELCRAYDP